MVRFGVTGQTQAGYGSVLRVRFGSGQGSVNRVNSVSTGQLTESTRSAEPVNLVDSVNSVNGNHSTCQQKSNTVNDSVRCPTRRMIKTYSGTR
ncbi:hypothetical protein Hanom_Chr07g00631641 [Helianthus anomalus]